VSIKAPPKNGFEVSAPVVVVGAGAAGFCAALAVHEAGVEVVVLERDSIPRGSTALSAGLIPAAGTRFQATRGITDNPALFAADLKRKAHDRADPVVVDLAARQADRLSNGSPIAMDCHFRSFTTLTIPAMRRGGCTAY
jgi:fumarate reductase flavoprotein subunit